MKTLILSAIFSVVGLGQTTPGLFQFTATDLSCGLVVRANTPLSQVQFYCYAGTPSVIVKNSLETLNVSGVTTFNWCAPVQPGCNYSIATIELSPSAVVATPGIQYTIAVNSAAAYAGVIQGVYGQTASATAIRAARTMQLHPAKSWPPVPPPPFVGKPKR